MVQSVADELTRHLSANQCVVLDRNQIDALTKLAFPRDAKGDWSLNRELVGAVPMCSQPILGLTWRRTRRC